jgi:hypothetical protein
MFYTEQVRPQFSPGHGGRARRGQCGARRRARHCQYRSGRLEDTVKTKWPPGTQRCPRQPPSGRWFFLRKVLVNMLKDALAGSLAPNATSDLRSQSLLQTLEYFILLVEDYHVCSTSGSAI